ncbi:MAG: tetratricopeptide repeat protein [Thiomicrospira sp.]|uniref:tetratricopeptide repeat protein n=1 Tax=Thiomicrospira sp. TaxID=935 RepID=UPI001A09C77B|nr:tetratricopeptide repeat protein [Thiomicrospira sp.]MBE0494649.1 tetratricopeptide repeat protein [Thiomicrospira sp.]
MIKFLIKSFVVLNLCCFPVYAANTENATNQQIQNSLKADFDAAKTLFDQGQFNQAYIAFEVLLNRTPENALVNFYFAMSAAALKRTDQAIAAFDRVLMLNPQSVRTRLELAKLYFEMGEYALAHAELDRALRANLPDAVRTNVLAFKARIDKQQSRHSHATTLVLTLGYDSNVNNGNGDTVELAGLTSLESVLPGVSLDESPDEQSDIGFGQTLVYNHSYDFGQRGAWSVNNQLVGLNRLNKDYSQNNVVYLGALTAPTYQHDIYKVAFPLEIDRVYLDANGYLVNASVGASLEQLLSANQTLAATYKLRSMQYDGDNSIRNAHSNIYSMRYRHAIGDKPLILDAHFSYENRQQTKNANADPASLIEKVLKLNTSKVLSARWRFMAGASYTTTDYVQVDWRFDNKRADQVTRFDLGGQYQINRTSLTSASLNHAIHDSNQGYYEFDKTQINLNYIYRF